MIDAFGSSFQQLDGEWTGVFGIAERTTATVGLLGTLVNLTDFAQSEWWQARAALEVNHALSDHNSLSGGAAYHRDALSFPETATQSSFVQLGRDDARRVLELRGSLEHVAYLTADEDFGETHPAEFNYVRAQARLNALLMQDRRMSPYVQGVIADVRHPHKFISTDVNRDAIDTWVNPGVRLKPTDRLSIDLGLRYNHRFLQDMLLGEYSTLFVDGSLSWRPTDRVTLTGSVNRSLEEPDTEFSVVKDVTTYSAGLAVQLTRTVSLSANASYERTADVGDVHLWREGYVEIEAVYTPTENTRLFVNLFGKRGEDDVSGLDYERGRIAVGGAVTF